MPLKVHYYVYKSLPLDYTVPHESIPYLTLHYFKIHFNITLLSMSRSPKLLRLCQRIHPRTFVVFHIRIAFYSVTSQPTPKLGDHPLLTLYKAAYPMICTINATHEIQLTEVHSQFTRICDGISRVVVIQSNFLHS